MSEWKTRVTKVHIPTPVAGGVSACLVLIYPPGPDMGRRFLLDRAELVLGRGTDCDIQVDRDSVSRRHARVYRDDNNWLVEDLGSTNGSYVNDNPVTKAPLRDGDFLKIGAAIFKFLTGANVEVSYHEEIYRMTIVDALTGTHNKRYFIEFLDREMARCAREVACNTVGEGHPWHDRESCVTTMKTRLESELRPASCPRGIDQNSLGLCLDAIRNESCGKPMETLARASACANAKLCLSAREPD